MVIHIIGNKARIILFSVLTGLLTMCLFGCGILYPKKIFSFQNLNENFYWGAANKACDMASESTPEINVLFRRTGNSFKTIFFPVFLTKKNYTRLHINSMKYLYDNQEISVLSDIVYILPQQVVEIGTNKSGWITNGNYFWLNGNDVKCEDPNNIYKKWPETNFEKLFKDKKIGDEFYFSVKIIYKFDYEDEKNLEIPFSVKTLKGDYVSPFAGK